MLKRATEFFFLIYKLLKKNRFLYLHTGKMKSRSRKFLVQDSKKTPSRDCAEIVLLRNTELIKYSF